MDEIRLDPEPSILIESLRDIGYSFNSAIADIVDNSITAGASEIQILAIPSEDFQVAIVDNGEGLSHDDLRQAMRLGSSDPRQERALNDLGRFGLGLKTASFSQCRRLTVVSRQGGETNAFTWDLDRVVETNLWNIIARDDYDQIPLIDLLGSTGTLVLWEKIDRLTGSRGSGKVDHNRIISEAQDYLALVFHRYIAGERGLKKIKLSVNGRELKAIDPFNTKNSKTQQHQVEQVCPGVTMQAFTLPHKSTYSSQQEYEYYGLKGGYLQNQGVYLYRAKRLIRYGTWFGVAKKSALTQLTRVKIDIGPDQDELWKIDVKKVSAQMPEEVRNRLKSLIETIGAPSRKAYRRRATKLVDAKAYPAWNVEQVDGSRYYRINREHPNIEAFTDSLDKEGKANFASVLSLIESTFPTETLYYDLVSKSDGKVEFAAFDDERFPETAKTFFASLKQRGKSDEEILLTMQEAEPFASRWDATLKALGIGE